MVIGEISFGGRVVIADANEARELIDASIRHLGHVDILINNAAIVCRKAPLQEMEIEDIDRMIDTNLKGPMYLMKYVLPSMVVRERGTIVNVNSIAGKTAFPNWSPYVASKFGLGAATIAVGDEQRPKHIRVVAVYPAAVDTPVWGKVKGLGQQPDRTKMLAPEAIADAVLYAISQPDKVYVRELSISPTQPAG